MGGWPIRPVKRSAKAEHKDPPPATAVRPSRPAQRRYAATQGAAHHRIPQSRQPAGLLARKRRKITAHYFHEEQLRHLREYRGRPRLRASDFVTGEGETLHDPVPARCAGHVHRQHGRQGGEQRPTLHFAAQKSAHEARLRTAAASRQSGADRHRPAVASARGSSWDCARWRCRDSAGHSEETGQCLPR